VAITPHRLTDMHLTQLQETGQIKLYGPTRLGDILDGLQMLGIPLRDVVVSVEGHAIVVTVTVSSP
jgi:hypothetical protein